MHGNPLHRFAKRQRVLPTTAETTNARAATTTARTTARTTAATTTAATRARTTAVASSSTTARGQATLFTGNTRSTTEAAAETTATRARTTANTVEAETSATQRAAVTSNAGTSAIASSSSSSTGSSSAAKGTSVSDNSTSKSSSNGGTIAGVIIAIVVVLAAIIGFVLWRKKRAARARGSGTALVGGGGGGNSGFKKQKDDDDEMFGNSSTGGSPFAGNEKYADSPNAGAGYGSMAAAGAGAVGGWGAAQQYNNHQQQSQQRQASPTWDSPAAYPTMNAAPTSTANLLSNANGQPSHNEIESREMQQHLDNMRQQQQSPFKDPSPSAMAPKGLGMMDAGLAGAAGIGAVKLAQQQQQQPEVTSPFGDHPGQGSIHVVKRTFEPSLDDELVLFPGNRVQMLIKYDDGWALGINLDSDSNPPAKGVFPFDCLGEVLPTGASAPATTVISPQPQQPPQPLGTITEADSRPPSPTTNGAPPALAAQQQQEDDSLGYLSYDSPDPEQPEPEQQQQPASSHSSITSQLPPQLPNLRSDSPIDFSSPPSSATTPAPLSASATEFTMPSIQISDPSGEDTTSKATAGADYFGEQALPQSLQAGGGAVDAVKNREGEKSKRTSSLIASRDADLFVALGEVLGKDEQQKA